MFIADALAQTAGAAHQPSLLGSLLPLILIFFVFYFLMIRPQVKRQKAHQEMVNALKKGDQVITSGGIVGKVVKAEETMLQVEIASGIIVKIERATVASLTEEKIVSAASKPATKMKSKTTTKKA
jgi:preprotein translocase subunit YajC